MSQLRVLALTASALLATTAPAHAHPDLVASRPADGGRLSAEPSHVVLEFARPVRVAEGSIEVRDPSGSPRAQAVLLSQTGRAVSVVLEPAGGAPVRSGGWTVRYRVRGSDGHDVTGRLSFAVDGAAARAQAPLAVLPAVAIALLGLGLVVLVLGTWIRRQDTA